MGGFHIWASPSKIVCCTRKHCYLYETAISISMYNSTSTPSTSTDIRINIFVLIFVLSVRIEQVIRFVWMNVFNCNNGVNVTACVAISTC